MMNYLCIHINRFYIVTLKFCASLLYCYKLILHQIFTLTPRSMFNVNIASYCTNHYYNYDQVAQIETLLNVTIDNVKQHLFLKKRFNSEKINIETQIYLRC